VEHLLLSPAKALARPPVELIFPHEEPVLRQTEVARMLNCTPRHVANLLFTEKRVKRADLIAFLREREVRP
jgi:hypothetical protein